jgi:sulfonate transport system permease protein
LRPPAALRGSNLGERLLPWLPPALFALWWLASRNHWMSEQILPAPSLVWSSAVELAGWRAVESLGISLQRLFGAAGRYRRRCRPRCPAGVQRAAERLVFPTFGALAQVPTLAWIPLFMVFFGIGEVLKLVVLVKAIVVPVTLHTLVGVRDAQPKLREAAACCACHAPADPPLVLPAALPAFMAGVRLALAAGWTSLLAVELLASSEGIGYLMVWARQLFMLDIVFVCIVVIGLLGVAMDRGIGWLDRSGALAAPGHRADSSWPALSRLATPATGLLPLRLLALWQVAAVQGWVDANILASPGRCCDHRARRARWQPDGALGKSLARTLGGLLLGGRPGLCPGPLAGTVAAQRTAARPDPRRAAPGRDFRLGAAAHRLVRPGELAKGCSSPSPRSSRC